MFIAGFRLRADALDHDHRALEQDQLGAGLHAEALGHLEEMREQPRHRDPRRVLAEDRLADRAQRLGEGLDVAVARHVAGLEMHLGDAVVVAAQEADQDLGVDPAGIGVDPAHDAEVEGDERAVGAELQVALVHVGVEEAVAQRVGEEGLDDPLGEPHEVGAAGLRAPRGRPC